MSSSSSPVAASLRNKPDNPRKTLFVDPVPSAVPTQQPALTTEQAEKYAQVIETAKSWTQITSTMDGKSGPITEEETMWLTRQQLLRYLRATKWTVKDACTRLLQTITWRREYGVTSADGAEPPMITPDHVSTEAETGKMLILGFDVTGRPCLYMSPGRQNTDVSPRQVHFVVFMMERLLDMMGPGQETLAFMINFKTGPKRGNTAPGIGQGREVLNIVQNYYPERLGRACIINVPWIVSGFFKLITPFIDPLTRPKLKFNDDNTQFVPADQLWDEFGGKVDFQYDQAEYWPTMIALCEERRAAYKLRWEAGGKQLGECEDYLKGMEGAKSVGTTKDTVQAAPKATSESASPEENIQVATTSAPTQSHGAQANGNMDLAATPADPILSTEGDRA